MSIHCLLALMAIIWFGIGFIVGTEVDSWMWRREIKRKARQHND